MNFKTCSKCHKLFYDVAISFSKSCVSKDGFQSWCKSCTSDYKKDYYNNNRYKILHHKKLYYAINRDEIAKRNKRYDISERGKTIRKSWRMSEQGKECLRSINKKYRLTKKGRNNKRLISKKFYDNNSISKSISVRINRTLNGNKCNNSWNTLVGYTIEKLKNHIESLFQPGMSWDNYGKFGWHIDHKIPVSSFNITSYECEDFKKCWALENLQPLWWRDNLRKGNKVAYNE